MLPTWHIAAATGHRPQHLSLPERRWSARAIRFAVARLRDFHGTEIAVSGMALGTDMCFGEAALEVDLRLWAHIPFPQQPDVWRDPRDVARWQRLREAATWETVYGDHYDVDLLGERNNGMLYVTDCVDGVVVALHKPSRRSGGTAGALREARKRGLPIIHINPEAETVTWPPTW